MPIIPPPHYQEDHQNMSIIPPPIIKKITKICRSSPPLSRRSPKYTDHPPPLSRRSPKYADHPPHYQEDHQNMPITPPPPLSRRSPKYADHPPPLSRRSPKYADHPPPIIKKITKICRSSPPPPPPHYQEDHQNMPIIPPPNTRHGFAAALGLPRAHRTSKGAVKFRIWKKKVLTGPKHFTRISKIMARQTRNMLLRAFVC